MAKERARNEPASPRKFAVLYALLGDKDQAFAKEERAPMDIPLLRRIQNGVRGYMTPRRVVRALTHITTHAALNLQEKELISYVRGHITIVDRPGLETHACE